MAESPDEFMDLVKLRPLMEHTRGVPELKIGLVDGPVALLWSAFPAATPTQVRLATTQDRGTPYEHTH